MPQPRPRSTQLILAAFAMMSIVCLGTFAAAQDLTITDLDPQLIFDDDSGMPYSWEIDASKFGFLIIDGTAGTRPIYVQTSAPDFSITIDPSGLIGLGTFEPQANVHISTLNMFPTLRLESVSALAPYAWDIQATASGFAIIDVISNSAPFGVQAGAPQDSLYINSAGNVGFGTSDPTAPIHVRKAAQAATAEIVARFAVSDDPIGSLAIVNSSAGDGLFIPKIIGRSASQNAALINEAIITNDVGASPAIVYNAAKGAGGALVTRPLVVYRNNSVAKVTIAANGVVTATSFNPVSSRTMKHDIANLDSREATNALHQLTPVKFIYNDDESNEKHVGFIAEDVPDIVAASDRQSVPIMDVVALVTRVVKDQQQTIDEQKLALNEQKKSMVRQQETNDQQQKTIDLLMKRLETLESQASAGK